MRCESYAIIPEKAPLIAQHIEYNTIMCLTPEQQSLLENPHTSKIFLHGLAGTGKTTAGVKWLKKLLKSGIPAHQIMVFVPQRALSLPYQAFMRDDLFQVHSLINTMTLGSLARRTIDLFWPMISPDTGVSLPNQPPHFLTLETAQYYMAHIVRPLMDEEGFFDNLTINRNRIYSQILDNLNKSALVGFSHQEIGDRLKTAWIGDIAQINVYDDVQACANRFRVFCLEHNLLDFSLQVEIFLRLLWPSPLCRDHLTRSYRHLIVDNVEEDTPVTHDILSEWLPEFDSALIIFDNEAGYRYFLGADVQSAFSLSGQCDTVVEFTMNLVNAPGIIQIKSGVRHAIAQLEGKPQENKPDLHLLQSSLVIPQETNKYFPDMIRWVANQINILVKDGVSPGEIVVLAPFMPDVLRFGIANQLDEFGIPHFSHRPSRALRDEPATKAMLTLASTAFSAWKMLPKRINIAFALMQVIDGLDLVRAQLLTAYVYNENTEGFPLQPFDAAPIDIRDRITYRVGARYDLLQNWLKTSHISESNTLDFFLSRMFGEVLSQPGFGFHNDLNSANTIANLIESIQKFRWAVGDQIPNETFSIGKEYIQMVQDGVIAAQYVRTSEELSNDAVFLSPAYTFLISNHPVDVQFWLDVGSPSWYQRLEQPLTHPYVLSRHWKYGDVWDAEKELYAAQETLRRLSIGLLNRCRNKVYLGMSELDVRGYDNRGLLVRIFQHILQRAQQQVQND